jgi:hypothetical protein
MICNDGPELPVCGKSLPQTAAASRAKHQTERMRIMNKNFMKKTMAAMTAFLTMTALIVPGCASAANSSQIDSGSAHHFTTSAETAQIPVYKDIVAFNPENKMVYEPNIVYSYAITSANVTNATITTHKPNSADPTALFNIKVLPGVIGAITATTDSGDATARMVTNGDTRTGTITFGPSLTMKQTNLLTLSADDESYVVNEDYKFTQNMKLTVDASKIYDADGDGKQDAGVEPGVYRYKISDVTPEVQFDESGITDGGAPNDIFLDVYVKYNEEQDGFVVYGYVLLKSTVDEDNTSITYSTEEDDGVKIEGFVTTAEGDDNHDNSVIPADLKSDRYKTYNVNISVEAKGDLADRTHQFPLEIELTSDTIKNLANFDFNDGEKRHMVSLDAYGRWNSSDHPFDDINYCRKHGEVYCLVGLPAGMKVRVTETNDTNDTYGISAKCNAIEQMMQNAAGNQNGYSITAAATTDDNNTIIYERAGMMTPHTIALVTKADEVVITNTRTDVSVTGIAMDIAPFIFMTCAGVILLAVFLRSRRKTDDGNRI